MRHLVAGSKLKRDSGSRKSLLRNLVTSVILEERVVTTVTKAKAVKPLIDKMITLGKRDTLHARRQAACAPDCSGDASVRGDLQPTRYFAQRNRWTSRVRPVRLRLKIQTGTIREVTVPDHSAGVVNHQSVVPGGKNDIAR